MENLLIRLLNVDQILRKERHPLSRAKRREWMGKRIPLR